MGKGTQGSHVGAGGLFFFSEAVPGAFKDDVLTSNLAFELNATIKHNKFQDWARWRQVYLTRLSEFGYAISRRSTQSIPVEQHQTVWSLVTHTLGQTVPTSLIEQAQSTFEYLQRKGGEELSLLRGYAVQELPADRTAQLSAEPVPLGNTPAADPQTRSVVAMQLAFVDVEPVVTQVFISFKTTSPAAALPFPHLLRCEDVVGNLDVTTVTSELEDYRYARFREGFVNKLGHRRAALIVELGEVLP